MLIVSQLRERFSEWMDIHERMFVLDARRPSDVSQALVDHLSTVHRRIMERQGCMYV